MFLVGHDGLVADNITWVVRVVHTRIRDKYWISYRERMLSIRQLQFPKRGGRYKRWKAKHSPALRESSGG
jgi:hypothetical protein